MRRSLAVAPTGGPVAVPRRARAVLTRRGAGGGGRGARAPTARGSRARRRWCCWSRRGAGRPGARRRPGPRVLAGDDVVDLGDVRLAGVDAGGGQDRDERLAEGIEGLLGLPDVEDVDAARALQRAVIEPARRSAGAGVLEVLERR